MDKNIIWSFHWICSNLISYDILTIKIYCIVKVYIALYVYFFFHFIIHLAHIYKLNRSANTMLDYLHHSPFNWPTVYTTTKTELQQMHHSPVYPHFKCCLGLIPTLQDLHISIHINCSHLVNIYAVHSLSMSKKALVLLSY